MRDGEVARRMFVWLATLQPRRMLQATLCRQTLGALGAQERWPAADRRPRSMLGDRTNSTPPARQQGQKNDHSPWSAPRERKRRSKPVPAHLTSLSEEVEFTTSPPKRHNGEAGCVREPGAGRRQRSSAWQLGLNRRSAADCLPHLSPPPRRGWELGPPGPGPFRAASSLALQ